MFRVLLLAALGLVVAAGGEPWQHARRGPRDLSYFSFTDYLAEHPHKQYNSSTVFAHRRSIFSSGLLAITAHNRGFLAGKVSWWMDAGPFTDWTDQEFEMLLKHKPSSSSTTTSSAGTRRHQLTDDEFPNSVTNNPPSFDWRSHNAVSPVKNQGHCGSCWAFAAAETVESHFAIAQNATPLVLAPQAYVSCVRNMHACGGAGGCDGATSELAFALTETAGIPLESALPYKGSDTPCASYKPAVKATGYTKLPPNNPLAFESALVTHGPLAVVVAASAWKNYRGGPFTGCSGCSPDGCADLNHGVQVVGFTPTTWTVRNSWGPTVSHEPLPPRMPPVLAPATLPLDLDFNLTFWCGAACSGGRVATSSSRGLVTIAPSPTASPRTAMLACHTR